MAALMPNTSRLAGFGVGVKEGKIVGLKMAASLCEAGVGVLGREGVEVGSDEEVVGAAVGMGVIVGVGVGVSVGVGVAVGVVGVAVGVGVSVGVGVIVGVGVFVGVGVGVGTAMAATLMLSNLTILMPDSPVQKDNETGPLVIPPGSSTSKIKLESR